MHSESIAIPGNRAYQWEEIAPDDLAAIDRLANEVHQTLPERPEVFSEKISLFPQGCRKLTTTGQLLGYGVSHAWLLNNIPPLDSFLEQLPAHAECIYIHDIVVHPTARGIGASKAYIGYIKSLAKALDLTHLALVSVYGTTVLWERYGFRVVSNPVVNSKLSSYGESARYMICDLN